MPIVDFITICTSPVALYVQAGLKTTQVVWHQKEAILIYKLEETPSRASGLVDIAIQKVFKTCCVSAFVGDMDATTKNCHIVHHIQCRTICHKKERIRRHPHTTSVIANIITAMNFQLSVIKNKTESMIIHNLISAVKSGFVPVKTLKIDNGRMFIGVELCTFKP